MTKIVKLGERTHSKASERYVDVIFNYEDAKPWNGSIPIEYRRTGTDLSDPLEIEEYLLQSYDHCHPSKRQAWLAEQSEFWKGKPRAAETKGFFDGLIGFAWTCVTCQLPSNPNWARRIQDLKEFGYTIATDTNKLCPNCRRNRTQLILVPLPRGGITGYETWSPAVRKRIISLLDSYDVYEGRRGNKDALLPDHKFPEIRWDEQTRRESLEDLTDEQIRRDFQLLSNQRNQQKREVCRNCYQTGKRGQPFGIPFYYEGDENWPADVPKVGKDAERGCHGCGWYDMERWRAALSAMVQAKSGEGR